MLRAVLLGVLTLTAVSCKSHDAATSASQSVAAGKVIEVVGSVTLHHGSDTRPLAKGDMIDADDVVETGADGSAVIEVQHNNVNWEIGAGKKGKLRESLAWSAPKKDKSGKAADEDSTAAGRHAERSAADNSVTAAAPAETEREREDTADEKKESAKAAVATQGVIAPQAPPAAQAEAPGGGAPPPVAAAAPAPPPPPPPKPAPKAAATTRAMPPSKSATLAPKGGASDDFGAGGLGLTGTGVGGGGAGEGIGIGTVGTIGHGGGTGTGQGYGNGGGSLGGGGGGGAATSPNAEAGKLVHAKDADLKKCFKAGTTVSLRITIDADGKAKVFAGSSVTDAQKTCVQNIVDKLEFAKKLAMVALTIKA